jgi:O-antigen/teichoic acid export membrane protein
MHPRRRLTENIAALTLLQLLNYAAPLITVPYLVRVLQPAQFGLLSFAQAIALYFSVLTDYGFDFSATRAIAAHRHIPESVCRVFWSTMLAKAILMSVSGIALISLVAAVPKLRETPEVYLASFLYVVGTALFPIWFFQGTEEIRLAALAFGIARLLTIPALLIFVRHPSDYVKAAAIQASVEMIASAVAFPLIWKRSKVAWYRPSFSDVADAFRRGWPLFLSGSALYLSTSSTTMILGFVAGKAQVGYYSAAEKLIKASSAALTPINQALYPHITATKVQSSFLALQLIRKSLAFTAGISLAISVSLLVLARPVCHVVLGNSFAPSVGLLRWLSPLPLLFGLMSVLGTQTMLIFEMDAAMSRIMLASAVLGLPLTLILSWLFGASGAAVGSVTIAALMVAAMVSVLRARGLIVWRESIPDSLTPVC